MAETDTNTHLALDIERTLASPPERVFRAWTDPAEMRSWFAPDPAMEIEADADPRVGGQYRIRMGEYVVSGTYEAVDRPSRLVFTWRWEGASDAAETLVTVELSRSQDGGTDLRLRHERLPDAKERESHAQGWEGCLAQLERHLAA